MITEKSSTVTLTLRMDETQKERVEQWRREQTRIPSVTEALRILLDRGLEAR